jgi:hypothetical protein
MNKRMNIEELFEKQNDCLLIAIKQLGLKTFTIKRL